MARRRGRVEEYWRGVSVMAVLEYRSTASTGLGVLRVLLGGAARQPFKAKHIRMKQKRSRL